MLIENVICFAFKETAINSIMENSDSRMLLIRDRDESNNLLKYP